MGGVGKLFNNTQLKNKKIELNLVILNLIKKIYIYIKVLDITEAWISFVDRLQLQRRYCKWKQQRIIANFNYSIRPEGRGILVS